ncbi:deoxyribose-phosphate aldolase [Aliidiomarina taiwanensis]|uniref:Deoxyribose-phosphate aldolase n=1 Tax=Aliidiomarina taiwanensis TaxID=946228 RepID=A0A432WVN6_9GAMM|nr:deoxyribose-phosphate aldolase [Aliidiomarina taiwanensis]RUO37832.1 deoxyribose-phosphate aldolase [Aliidiomarina taiwanensis]
MHDLQEKAAQAFSLLDLTSLTDTETAADIEALAENARLFLDNGERLQVAALCVFPRFIPMARQYLDARDLYSVRIATVANFPHGGDNIDIAVAETRACVAYGADEVDVVFPYQAFLEGDETVARLLIKACKRECGTQAQLKVILETGILQTPEHIHRASQLAIEAGADFIKTSTGKVDVNATPEAAQHMLAAIAANDAQHIREHPVQAIGFKPAGGIRTLDDALVYMQAVADHLGPDAVHPSRFRIGASSVRAHLVHVLTGQAADTQGGY